MMSMDSYRGGNGSVITATTANNAKTSTGWYEQQCHQQQQHQVTMSSNQLDTSSTTTTDMQLLEEARKMCMQDIDVACKKLGISPDPYSWSMGEVFSWLRWLQTSNNLLPIHLDYFQLDGEHLCRLSEHDFRQRCPTPEVGEFIYGRLDLWKLGFSYLNQTPTTDTYDYGGRQAAATAATATQYDNSYGNSCPITTTTTATSNMGSYAADAGYGSIPRPNQLSYNQHHHHHQQQQQQPHVHQSQHQHYGSPSAAFSPSSNAGSNYSSCMSPVPSPAGSISSSVSSSSSSSCYGTSPSHFGGAGHMTPHSFASTATSLGGQSPPNTTATSTTNNLGHMFNVNSHTSDYGSDGILSDDDDIEDDKWMVRAMLAQQQQPPAQYPVVGNNVQQQQPQQHPGLSMYAGSGYSPSHVSYHHHHQHAMSPPTGSSYARPVANMATTAAAGQVMSSSAVSSTTPAATTTTTTMPTTLVKPMIKTGSGSSIHLWQFLKELLQSPQTYSGFIRWLDREKGVFKIEDSVRVAKLWGGRKNRPAMNYDKLSRSIRQYYKKGIMKKTERSQRLVYQFCAPYAL